MARNNLINTYHFSNPDTIRRFSTLPMLNVKQ